VSAGDKRLDNPILEGSTVEEDGVVEAGVAIDIGILRIVFRIIFRLKAVDGLKIIDKILIGIDMREAACSAPSGVSGIASPSGASSLPHAARSVASTTAIAIGHVRARRPAGHDEIQ